jgi:5-formyltetrahydrofolate cyclo-ligase
MVDAPALPDRQSRGALRRLLRLRRNGLSPAQRVAAARTIAARVARTPWLQPRRAIGLYVSVGNEVSTVAVRALALRRGCSLYLPRIVDYGQHRMLFVPARGAPGGINRYGIPEPAGAITVPARALSVVFVPVLGFDPTGTRLGSGVGFYDRLFSFRRAHSGPPPLLVGLAFSCQQLPCIERRTHDVPLDVVVTEERVLMFPRNARTDTLVC